MNITKDNFNDVYKLDIDTGIGAYIEVVGEGFEVKFFSDTDLLPRTSKIVKFDNLDKALEYINSLIGEIGANADL